MTRLTTRAGPPVVLAILLALAPDGAGAQALTLAEAARAALETHPAMTASRARLDGADERLAAARAQRLPSVQLDANLTRFEEPMIVAPLHTFNLSSPPRFDASLVQGRLGMAYTIFDGRARSARIEGANAMTDVARLGGAVSEMALLEGTAGAFFMLGSARAVRDGASAQVVALEEELARAQRHVDAGTAARVELLRAGAAFQESRAQLAGAEAQVELARRNLARMMGIAPDQIAGRPLAPIPLAAITQPVDTWSNPMIEQARSSVAAAQAFLSEERAGRFPRLDAGGGVLDFGTLEGSHVFEWQVGLQVSWPLFTGGARNASIRRAEADVRLARAELAQAELDIEAAIDGAGTAVTEADARAGALEAAVEQWAEVARIEALALEAGSGVQSDLLRAQAGLFQARAGLARAHADAAFARVSLARALGTLNSNSFNESPEEQP